MKNLIITTYPFGNDAKKILSKLTEYSVSFNEAKRKYSMEELHKILQQKNPEVIIAGTEKYTSIEFDICSNLKMISRVGIGVDGIDFNETQKRNIIVANTPDAPSNAVAELTICQILNMLRKVQNVSDDIMIREKWNRYIGRELKNCIVGIIGFGRIGKLVYDRLLGFLPRQILVNDIKPLLNKADISQIIRECDVITIHIPLKEGNTDNNNFITIKELNMMKQDVRLLNLSRGGIINEDDLYEWLATHPKATAAVDAFTEEPYRNKLSKLGNAYLTPHLGSCTIKSRYDMEVGSVQNVLEFLQGRINFGL